MGDVSEIGSWLPIEAVLLNTSDIAEPLPSMSPLSSYLKRLAEMTFLRCALKSP